MELKLIWSWLDVRYCLTLRVWYWLPPFLEVSQVLKWVQMHCTIGFVGLVVSQVLKWVQMHCTIGSKPLLFGFCLLFVVGLDAFYLFWNFNTGHGLLTNYPHVLENFGIGVVSSNFRFQLSFCSICTWLYRVCHRRLTSTKKCNSENYYVCLKWSNLLHYFPIIKA